MRGLWALAILEARTVFRDRTMQIMFLVTAVSSAFALPLWELLPKGDSEVFDAALTILEASDADEVAAPKGPPCPSAGMPSVSLLGLLPEDVQWPYDFVDADDAMVQLVVSSDDDETPLIRVVSDGDEGERVARCVRGQVVDAREARYAALGLPNYPRRLIEVEETNPPESDEAFALPPLSGFGIFMGCISLMISGSLAIEAVPRRRASGLFEQLRCTQTTEGELVWAWVISLTGIVVALCGLCAAFYLPVAVYLGNAELLVHGLHAPAIAAIIAAASIRTSLHANDVQAASIRWFGVLFALVILTGVSVYWIDRPWMSAVVPLGGSMMAMSGALGPVGFVSDVAALGWTALLVAWSAHSLRVEDSAAAGGDATLQRQATGNYLPEVLFLTGLGLASGLLGGGAAFHGNLWAGMTFSFVGFMLIPSLLAGPVLGLRARSLLPLGRVNTRDLALTVPLFFGLWGLSTLVMGATVSILPNNAMIEGLASGLNDVVQTPFGAFAIGVYPAICEELLYRGAILGLLLKGGNARRAVVIQALAFSLAHIISIRLPWTFVFGLVMGWIRVRTGSLWACMAVHFVFNTTIAVLLPYFMGEQSTEFDSTQLLYALPLLLGLAVLPLFSKKEVGEVVEP
ncbi:MAG: CPBP family intramembrane metalloprotease [Rhodobacterales bacterium]|nr:CPBP family intramembrane metalloprotease [Rhodobacterales bacterium]